MHRGGETIAGAGEIINETESTIRDSDARSKCLKVSYRELNRYAASGIDRVSYVAYGKRLDENIAELVERLKSKRYRAVDIRRVWIPKPEGGRRPLGILVLEDKIVQIGVVKILSAIYEQDFLDVSYRFRENRHKGSSVA